MKKITLLVLLLIVASSCLKRADKHDYRTAYGATVLYEGVSYGMISNEFILAVVEMDIIAETTIEKRDSVTERFFPACKFRISGDKYSLIRDNLTFMEVKTDGQSLSTPGAVWSVVRNNNHIIADKQVTITCKTENSWLLNIEWSFKGNPTSYNSELISERIDVKDSPRWEQFTVAMRSSDVVEPLRAIVHKLTTTDPLVVRYKYPYPQYAGQIGFSIPPTSFYRPYVYSPFVVVAGSITDTFTNPLKGKTEVADAIFQPMPQDYMDNVKITYCEISEFWYWDYIPHYADQYLY